MFINAYSENNFENIPQTQGLYAFFLNAISPAKIGLVGNNVFTDDQLLRAKKVLLKKVKKLSSFYRSNKLLGAVSCVDKSQHISEKYIVTAIEEYPESVVEMVDNTNLYDIYRFANLVASFPLLTQPIYIGITKKQTLYERYNQHKYNYYSHTDGKSFGSRLNSFGFDWDDVVFACNEFRIAEDNMEILSMLEKYFLTISKPVLSIA